MKELHQNFINWAISILGKDTDMKGRKLQIRYFCDGEPYIGTYPNLRYSTFLNNL